MTQLQKNEKAKMEKKTLHKRGVFYKIAKNQKYLRFVS